MKSFITSIFVKYFPSLGIHKRKVTAIVDSCRPTEFSYSQHGEDIYLYDQLKEYDISDATFVDVGSNHPTRLSNTYFFYRKGFHGVAIDANAELINLHRWVRPRDIALCFGCSKKSALGKFEVAKAPVLSRFQGSDSPENLGFEEWRLEFVPILPLDLVLQAIDYKWIFLLSVDVEGLDYEVLEGSVETLHGVLFCCVESSSDEQQKRIDMFMEHIGFDRCHQMACNTIYRNTDSKFEAYKSKV